MRRALVGSFLFLAGCSGEVGDARTPEAVADDDAATPDVVVTIDAAEDTPDAAPPQGLRGEYFDNFDDPRALRIDETIDFDWSSAPPIAGVPREYFSVRWTGEISIETAETFTFETRSDDGVRLVIDDKTVLENWTGHFATTDTGTIALTPGWHRIRLEYFQFDIGASLQLYWSSPSTPRAIVPSTVLRPATAPSAGRAPAPPYVNPVKPEDCPDPGVIRVDNVYYMACTGGPFTIFRSRDLVRWFNTGAAIIPSGKAPWSANGFRNWAPEIHKVGSRFVAYFTAVNGGDKLAIGAAYADAPTGPYTVTAAPLVDDPTPGVIDATYFRDDDGKHYLYWKRDGNQNGQATPMFVRELRDDGLGFAAGSTATQVLTNDRTTWEGGVVEAPWLVKNGSFYYLFYSGNVYDQRYRTGVARASSPRGPFTKLAGTLLTNNAKFVGPGHGSVVTAHGESYFVYHAWLNNGSGGTAAGGRRVLVDRIAWEGGWPKIADGSPSFTPQPWP